MARSGPDGRIFPRNTRTPIVSRLRAFVTLFVLSFLLQSLVSRSSRIESIIFASPFSPLSLFFTAMCHLEQVPGFGTRNRMSFVNGHAMKITERELRSPFFHGFWHRKPAGVGRQLFLHRASCQRSFSLLFLSFSLGEFSNHPCKRTRANTRVLCKEDVIYQLR